jgi:hypothetical protein
VIDRDLKRSLGQMMKGVQVVGSGRFSVSILAGDQIEQGQYFSYPGRRFGHVAEEYLDDIQGLPLARVAEGER